MKKTNTFGGLIFQSDYNTDARLHSSDIAGRILSDWRFDERCRRTIEAREKHTEVISSETDTIYINQNSHQGAHPAGI